ncbi:nuclear transport factor 2 family protein [Nocardia alni]|uniref:nuclear transport factor 2 family protein n=1 Tax=Nocardia alni TaxID=2815723 RepID=UPI0027DEEE78|nr:nuclear transport factor 2 family protein [Nocardia alni]
MIDPDLQRLQRDVQYLMDRTAILDCIARHARGCDRHDAEMISSAYHADGLDEHGDAVNTGPAYGEWANHTHAATTANHLHNITTHSCEIDGNVAHCESYSLGMMLGRDRKTAQVIGGRYIDRLEKRDGQWRIVVRRSTVELMFTADASALHSEYFTSQGYYHGTRDRDDLSYLRPLRLDSGEPTRW